MRKTLLRANVLGLVLLLVAAGTAVAIKLEASNLVITTDGGFTPTTLPKKGYAPIKLHGYGNIATKDGTPPPVLETVTIWFDKHGEVETKGLPKCTPGKLKATTTAQARKLCPGSIVGKGFGKAVVIFPEQGPIPASSPITLFNAAPKNGNPVLLAHAHLTVPGPTTFVVPIEIQKVHSGRYGFKVEAKIPKIAGGSGIPLYARMTVGREWTYKGKKLSFANAGCPDGRLQAKVKADFKDGTVLQGSLFKTCTGR
ncbi:MAG TPA: hypothetical protein VLK37_12280 [Solirubrobacterales bacterium]|nr:hypothetical protein [Solirubrobacterales bacterium]